MCKSPGGAIHGFRYFSVMSNSCIRSRRHGKEWNSCEVPLRSIMRQLDGSSLEYVRGRSWLVHPRWNSDARIHEHACRASDPTSRRVSQKRGTHRDLKPDKFGTSPQSQPLGQ